MSTSKDGGPAFPTVPLNHGYGPETSGNGTGSNPGMSLRDWFAGRALAGLLACPGTEGGTAAFADMAYRHADAMLAAREKDAQ